MPISSDAPRRDSYDVVIVGGAVMGRNFRERLGGDPEIPDIFVHHFGYMYLAADEDFADTLRRNQAVQADLGSGTRIMNPAEIMRPSWPGDAGCVRMVRHCLIRNDCAASVSRCPCERICKPLLGCVAGAGEPYVATIPNSIALQLRHGSRDTRTPQPSQQVLGGGSGRPGDRGHRPRQGVRPSDSAGAPSSHRPLGCRGHRDSGGLRQAAAESGNGHRHSAGE